MSRSGRWVVGALLWSAGCTVNLAPSCQARGEANIDQRSGDEDGPAATRDDAPPGPACPGARRSGVTECFPRQCGAGLYCDDGGGLSSCRPGCTSDANCGPNDTCVRPADDAVGRCEPCEGRERREVDRCGGPGRSGVSACFPGECAPGQYCVDAGMPHCEPGCTSDENCAPTERCERPDGSALGICRACDFVPPA